MNPKESIIVLADRLHKNGNNIEASALYAIAGLMYSGSYTHFHKNILIPYIKKEKKELEGGITLN